VAGGVGLGPGFWVVKTVSSGGCIGITAGRPKPDPRPVADSLSAAACCGPEPPAATR